MCCCTADGAQTSRAGLQRKARQSACARRADKLHAGPSTLFGCIGTASAGMLLPPSWRLHAHACRACRSCTNRAKKRCRTRTQRVSSGVQASGRASRCRPACLCVLHQLSSSKTILHSSNRQNECGRLCRLYDRDHAYLQHSRRTAPTALQS